jgi:transcriptional regulator with XRE-family HTH domain
MSQKHSSGDVDTLVGERVRSRCIQAKMSQTTLGKALGVTFQQIQKSEKSVNLFGSGRLLKIADVIECNVKELFGGDSDAPTIISTPFSKFMATKNGVAIIEAMLKIKTPALRRTVIEVAEKLAKT